MRFIGGIITLLLIFIGVRLCLTGNHLYDEALTHPQPEPITYAKFAAERPLQGWYRLSDGWIDVSEGAYRFVDTREELPQMPDAKDRLLLERAKVVYVPVHPEKRQKRDADLILMTRDADLVGAVKQLSSTETISRHEVAPRVIQGLIRLPSELPESVRRSLGHSVSTQSIIIEEYAAPQRNNGVLMMGVGGSILILLASAWLIVWRTDRRPILIPDEYLSDDDDDELNSDESNKM